jgi:hypothetical protein
MSAPRLPDFALTAYQLGGSRAVIELVKAGLMPAGLYECPACDGSGIIVERREHGDHRLARHECNSCLGATAFVEFTESVAQRRARGGGVLRG